VASKTVEGNLQGGKALKKYLKNIADELGAVSVVKVGFFEDATYSGGKQFHEKAPREDVADSKDIRRLSAGQDKFSGPVAQVAFWNEFGTKTPAAPVHAQDRREKVAALGQRPRPCAETTGTTRRRARDLGRDVVRADTADIIDFGKTRRTRN
jgi:hypothetical protein